VFLLFNQDLVTLVMARFLNSVQAYRVSFYKSKISFYPNEVVCKYSKLKEIIFAIRI